MGGGRILRLGVVRRARHGLGVGERDSAETECADTEKPADASLRDVRNAPQLVSRRTVLAHIQSVFNRAELLA